MARARAITRSTTHVTRALVLRRVPYSESDLVVTLLTESLGRVGALARGARRSQRRFAGSLEPIHTLRVHLDEHVGADLMTLREATIESARRHLVLHLDRLEAAGRALAWARRAAPPRTPEPQLWKTLLALLDRLDDTSANEPALALAEAGLQMLVALGWGIDFTRCVRCGTPCAPGQAARVDPARGGLLCRSCGGAFQRLSGDERERLARAAGGECALLGRDAELALGLVEKALVSHAGLR